MVFVEWRQHAVGHGGFHSGFADVDGKRLTWIYDCGSRSGRKFDDYLRDWLSANHDPIDWLFVSHFDKDHASGLAALMSSAVVRNVMLPYVNERELILSLLDEISRGNVDRELFELASDPAEFFISRGAERVIVVDPSESGEPTDPDLPTRPSPSGRDWIEKFDPPTTPFAGDTGRGYTQGQWRSIRRKPRHPVRRLNAGGSMSIERAGFSLRFLPYRAPIQHAHHQNLLSDLRRLVMANSTGRLQRSLGLGPLAYAVALHARTAQGRADLKGLHAAYAGSSNRASLSLSSTPIVSSARRHWVSVSTVGATNLWNRSFVRDGAMPVWLNTGDAELLHPVDLADWTSAYGPQLQDVCVASLPHHGSDNNSDVAFQTQISSNALLTAHVKAGAKKHPGGLVAAAAGRRLARVTWSPETAVCMHFTLI